MFVTSSHGAYLGQRLGHELFELLLAHAVRLKLDVFGHAAVRPECAAREHLGDCDGDRLAHVRAGRVGSCERAAEHELLRHWDRAVEVVPEEADAVDLELGEQE